MMKRTHLALICSLLAFGALTSCTAIPLFEIDIIEIVDSPLGTFGGATVTLRATFDNADSYSWDFGDGAVGAGQVVVHTYSTEGTFKVRLEITTGSRTLVGTKDIVIRLGSAITTTFTGQIVEPILDALEFDPVFGIFPDIIEVGPGVYAIAYQGPSEFGIVSTVRINSNGEIGSSTLDSLVFDANAIEDSSIVKVGNGIYAIAYGRLGAGGFVTTISIDSSGNIAGSTLETLQFDSNRAEDITIFGVGTGVYAIVYEGPGLNGFVTTVSINGGGDIGAAPIETFGFAPSDGRSPSVIEVGSGIYAIAYIGPGTDGFLATLSIDSNGDIGGATIDSFEFDPVSTNYPSIIEVGSGIYAISYTRSPSVGTVLTVGIDSSGVIDTTIIDTLDFEPAGASDPSIIKIGGGVYAIAYGGFAFEGFLKTVSIGSTGIIGTVIDTFEFDPNRGTNPSFFRVADGIIGIAYSGPSVDGFVITIQIN